MSCLEITTFSKCHALKKQQDKSMLFYHKKNCVILSKILRIWGMWWENNKFAIFHVFIIGKSKWQI